MKAALTTLFVLLMVQTGWAESEGELKAAVNYFSKEVATLSVSLYEQQARIDQLENSLRENQKLADENLQKRTARFEEIERRLDELSVTLVHMIETYNKNLEIIHRNHETLRTALLIYFGAQAAAPSPSMPFLCFNMQLGGGYSTTSCY
jgi:predicted nuclease with TOPRIM domain